MKKTSTLLFAILATVFVFSTGTAFAQQRGGQPQPQHQNGGYRGFDNRAGNQQHFENNRGFENRGNRGFENNRGFDNRGNRGFENNHGFDNRGQRGFENRGFDRDDRRFDRDDHRGWDRDDHRGWDRDNHRGWDRDHRDYRNWNRYNNYYRNSRDWDRYDRDYDCDGYRSRWSGNWGFYGNRGGWRGGIWIGLPGNWNYEIVVYENVYDDYYGQYRIEHVAYWSNYYGGYVWYDVNGQLRVAY